MNKSSDFAKRSTAIQAIKEHDIQKPNHIPIDVYLQEAEDLHHWCGNDLPELSARGLDPALVEELTVRCSVLREAQARWICIRQGRGSAESKWKETASGARALKKELTRTLRFAFHRRADLLDRLKGVTGGQGHADLVQALNDLALLGRENPELLDAANADPLLPERAARAAEETAHALAAATAEQAAEQEQALKLRDRAYTYLKEAVDEVRRCGKFVFRDDKKRLRGYRSEFLRELRKKKKAGSSLE